MFKELFTEGKNIEIYAIAIEYVDFGDGVENQKDEEIIEISNTEITDIDVVAYRFKDIHSIEDIHENNKDFLKLLKSGKPSVLEAEGSILGFGFVKNKTKIKKLTEERWEKISNEQI